MNQAIELTVRNAEILNSNQRLHTQEKNKRTRNLRGFAQVMARYKKLEPMGKTHCVVHLGFPNEIRRDPANYYPTVKAMIDGFVDAGIFVDDNHKLFIGPDFRVSETKSSRGAITFTFEFAEVN